MDEFPLIDGDDVYLPSFLPGFGEKLAVMQFSDASVLYVALRAVSLYVGAPSQGVFRRAYR
jgi:hypothetical protein